MTDSASICRIAAYFVAITIASEPATGEGLHETGKEIKSVCDTRRQLAALRTNLHAAVSAAESELSTGRHLVTKLQLAAAMTTGNDSLKFTTIAAGAAENLDNAVKTVEAARNKLDAATAALSELIGAADVVDDTHSLSLEGKPEAQTSTSGLPSGKFQIRYGAIAETKKQMRGSVSIGKHRHKRTASGRQDEGQSSAPREPTKNQKRRSYRSPLRAQRIRHQQLRRSNRERSNLLYDNNRHAAKRKDHDVYKTGRQLGRIHTGKQAGNRTHTITGVRRDPLKHSKIG
uniref:Variant surface glycoprotein 1125.1549 n=1 Tax=Trypanosoma brucei TaxID=5691 RepID=A0A1J0R7E2_9TRYP|nr:variant surface glycoprotein 1125.1549 [Trypanosoma brucei]